MIGDHFNDSYSLQLFRPDQARALIAFCCGSAIENCGHSTALAAADGQSKGGDGGLILRITEGPC